jgi:hypothetical protein
MPQKVEMFLTPGDNIVEVIASGDRGARYQQQKLTQRIDNTPGLAVKFGKVMQKQGQSRPRYRPDAERVARRKGKGSPPKRVSVFVRAHDGEHMCRLVGIGGIFGATFHVGGIVDPP